MPPIASLLPVPRQLQFTGGEFILPRTALIVLDAPEVSALRLAGSQLQAALHDAAHVDWEIVAGRHVPLAQIGCLLSVTPGATTHEQGYSLTISGAAGSTARIDAVASTPAGIFYAVQTLRQLVGVHQLVGVRQLLAQPGPAFSALPGLRCTDWPDFPHRGVMLDISRDRVPTMATLFDLIDQLAAWKVNQLQLYTEHTFAFRHHPVVWAEASPLTGAEILELDAYCHERFIELTPNLNTFGHMRRWLVHDPYKALAEAPDGCMTRWGWFNEPFTLNPLDPASLDLVRDMLDEMLPHFRSLQVNVGCDETVDLGMGRSAGAVRERGLGRVYLDFVQKIYREVKARGRTMQFWGDVIMEHPELVPELPRDAIAMEWGYEADHPFAEHGALFAASGIPFYVCAGTSSWRTLAGRTDNCIGNLRSAAVNGLQHGAVGFLNTDWGDEGHWQPLPVSYLGLVYGAALSWASGANLDLDLPAALDAHVFHDAAGVMGRLAYDLGNVYTLASAPIHNSSLLFNILQSPPDLLRALATGPDAAQRRTAMQACLERIDAIMAALPQAHMQRADADLIAREFTWVADMQRHACHRLLAALGDTRPAVQPAARQQETARLIAEYTAIWHARSRPGGFPDSVARMQAMGD